MAEKKTSVIVGTGLAGISAAEALRTQGFDGRVIVVGEESAEPYDRPPLTKGYLRGEIGSDEIALRPRSFYADHDIDLITSMRVESIDIHAAEVSLAGSARIPYDALLLATGAAPRTLAVPGADLAGVHLLRSQDDADALRGDAASAERIVVIGAGWIGCETAASLRQLGKSVVVVAPEAVPLERVLGREMGNVFSRLHADNGVELLLGRGVAALRGTHHVEAVLTSDGTEVACDLVIVGVGAVPRAELAEHAGIACSDGIRVDEWLRTTASNVYAAGDVANTAHARYGRLRVEHWANARDQGAHAALSMLGSQQRHERIPYFFSDQYDLGMEYLGLASASDTLVLRGDPASREFVAFWLDRAGRMTAGMNVNIWDVSDEIERLVSTSVPVDAAALADPNTPLSSLGMECVA
jgi:3-phenylpropionate/trans-cinnamate dioxygenase ferredoxin reductase subunit